MAQQSISRVYRSELRQQQAAQTRQKVVAAAAELFCSHGYARTTFAKIAAAAGVSAETVQAHGPKAALMRAAGEYMAFGVSDQRNVFDLDYGRGLLPIDDRDAAISYMVTVLTDVYERSASIWLALAAAATMEPELAGYHTDLVANVTLGCRRVLEVCRDREWLRNDIPFDDLVETTAVLTSVETYQRIVQHHGKSVDAYQKWVWRMLDETVFAR